MTLRWSETALTQLDLIHNYIAQDKPEAAAKTIQRIWRTAEMLAGHPLLGKPGRIEGTREFVKAPFVLVYIVADSAVGILSVFHGKQRW
jgi:plasmid stabilization system protein ParE